MGFQKPVAESVHWVNRLVGNVPVGVDRPLDRTQEVQLCSHILVARNKWPD
jgi:hypothetical protein